MRVVDAVVRRIRLHHLLCTIIHAVVADDDFDVTIRLSEGAFQCKLEELRPLVRRHEDAHQRQSLRRILRQESLPSFLVCGEALTQELHERLFLSHNGGAQSMTAELQALRRIEERRAMKEILTPRQIDLRRHEEAVNGEHIFHLAEYPPPGHRARTLGKSEGADAPRRVKGDAVGRQELRA